MTTPAHVVQLQVDQTTLRLDQYLAKELTHLSRSQLKKIIQQGQVFIADLPAKKPGTSVHPGDTVTVHLRELEDTTLQSESIPLDIAFEDEHIIVVNKPTGMVVHPAQGHIGGTLVNALLAHSPNLMAMIEADADSINRPGIVHRLDQDTSGLIIIARTPPALHHLRAQFKARSVEKIYQALVFGHPQAPEGIIDVPLGRDPRHRQKMAARPGGKTARTHYRVIESFDQYSLLEIGLETGRTHQIRVHLAWLKCPVVGDTIYGRKKNKLGLKRQFLHAWKLRFIHPHTEKILDFEAPLDNHLTAILSQLS